VQYFIGGNPQLHLKSVSEPTLHAADVSNY